MPPLPHGHGQKVNFAGLLNILLLKEMENIHDLYYVSCKTPKMHCLHHG